MACAHNSAECYEKFLDVVENASELRPDRQEYLSRRLYWECGRLRQEGKSRQALVFKAMADYLTAKPWTDEQIQENTWPYKSSQPAVS